VPVFSTGYFVMSIKTAFTHENGVTCFYKYGELVYVVVDHELKDALDLFHSILPRNIGACYDNGKTTLVKKGDFCDINPDPTDEDLLEAYLESLDNCPEELSNLKLAIL
jgi:hypothetical protein